MLKLTVGILILSGLFLVTGCSDDEPVINHDETVGPALLQARTEQLEKTIVTAHLQQEINEGKIPVFLNSSDKKLPSRTLSLTERTFFSMAELPTLRAAISKVLINGRPLRKRI